MDKTSTDPIKLTNSGWWQQIDALQQNGTLPDIVGCLLKGLVSSHMFKTIPPTATPNSIMLAKKYLRGGIEISDSAIDTLYDVVVYTPDNGKENDLRHFFFLIHKYPNGRLKYLDEL